MITEKEIRKGLKDYLKDTTTILIAQRITSVMDADKILVMDGGRIVGIGNHSELIDNSQVYRDIYRSQMGRGVRIYWILDVREHLQVFQEEEEPLCL